jgi:hypothetical protein
MFGREVNRERRKGVFFVVGGGVFGYVERSDFFKNWGDAVYGFVEYM